MNRQRLIEMAKECGFDAHDMSDDFTCNLENIETFAAVILLEAAIVCQEVSKEERQINQLSKAAGADECRENLLILCEELTQ